MASSKTSSKQPKTGKAPVAKKTATAKGTGSRGKGAGRGGGARSGSPVVSVNLGAGGAPERTGPAVGLLEIGSLSRGMVVCDAMVKRSPVDVLTTRPVSPGKYLVLVAGEVAEVDEAMMAGRETGAEQVVDDLILPNPHQQIVPAIRGQFQLPQLDDPDDLGAVAIIEATNVTGAILGADAAVKEADVHLFQMLLAKGIGGKACFAFYGDLNEVQAGVEAAMVIIGSARMVNRELIPRPHPDFVHRVVNNLL